MSFESKAAFQKDSQTSTYPVESGSLGAGDSVPILNESIKDGHERVDDNVLSGNAGLLTSDLIAENYAGGLSCQLRYNDLGPLLCAGFGFENPNDDGATYHGSPEADGSQYRHIFELDDNLKTEAWLAGEERYPSGSGGGTWNANHTKVRRGALGLAKGVSDWRYNSAMVNRMVFTFEPNLCKIDFDIIAYSRDRGDYSSSTWTFSSDVRNVVFPNITFDIDGTDYGIARAEVAIDNKLAIQRDTESGVNILEPWREDMRVSTLAFDFLRYEDDTFFDSFDNDTEFYCSIEAASGNYELGLYMNAAKFSDVQAPIPGSGILGMQHQAVLYRPSSNNFASVLGDIELKKDAEVFCALVNDHSTNYLTEV